MYKCIGNLENTIHNWTETLKFELKRDIIFKKIPKNWILWNEHVMSSQTER